MINMLLVWRLAFLWMILAVAASNYLVQFPLNDWLTWSAFTYPFTFLITELTNRFYGPSKARQVVYVGFIVAIILSIKLASLQIALASGTAFLISQLLDIFVFNSLRQRQWWKAPLLSSVVASILDTALFWNLAFLGQEVSLLTWALGDLGIKLLLDFLMLTPFRLAIRLIPLSRADFVLKN